MTSSAAQTHLATIELGGVRLHAVTETQCVEHILGALRERRGGWVVTPNLDHLRRCQRDPAYRELVRQADLVTADGMPLVWLSHLQGTPLPERVAGSSMIHSLCAAAAHEARSIYLMGGDEGTAEEAGNILCSRNPGLRLAGFSCPQLDDNPADDPCERLAADLSAVRPDIVFVGLGSPKQERVIYRLASALPSAWWLGVGISFSFVCQRVRRAPVWMQRAGLEWLHRLWQEPGRLARRYLVDGLPFFARLFILCCWSRLLGKRPGQTASDTG